MSINKFVNIIAMEGIKSLNEDLHATIQAEYEMESWLILDVTVIVGKSMGILTLSMVSDDSISSVMKVRVRKSVL